MPPTPAPTGKPPVSLPRNFWVVVPHLCTWKAPQWEGLPLSSTLSKCRPIKPVTAAPPSPVSSLIDPTLKLLTGVARLSRGHAQGQTDHHQPSFKVGGSSPQLSGHALRVQAEMVQEDKEAEAVGRSALRPAFPEARRPLLTSGWELMPPEREAMAPNSRMSPPSPERG